MISKKIALLGMWGVGKTSLVRRFVDSIYEDKYHSTLGVKVDKKLVSLEGGSHINMLLWDIAGAEDHFSVPMHYVRGAAGYLVVIDGTRSETLDRALDLIRAIEASIGSLPFVTVINKADLPWQFSEEDVKIRLEPYGCTIFKSSAKTGENVEAAFAALGRKL